MTGVWPCSKQNACVAQLMNTQHKSQRPKNFPATIQSLIGRSQGKLGSRSWQHSQFIQWNKFRLIQFSHTWGYWMIAREQRRSWLAIASSCFWILRSRGDASMQVGSKTTSWWDSLPFPACLPARWFNFGASYIPLGHQTGSTPFLSAQSLQFKQQSHSPRL